MDSLIVLMYFLGMTAISILVMLLFVISNIINGYRAYKEMDIDDIERKYQELKSVVFEYTDEDMVFGGCMCLMDLEWALRFHKMFPRE